MGNTIQNERRLVDEMKWTPNVGPEIAEFKLYFRV